MQSGTALRHQLSDAEAEAEMLHQVGMVSEGSSAGASISPANGSAAGMLPAHPGGQGGGHDPLPLTAGALPNQTAPIVHKSIGIQTRQVMMR